MPETHQPDPKRWTALIFIALAQLMVVLDATIANIALPYIGRDLNMSGTNLTWIVTGYALAFGSLLLIGSLSISILLPLRATTRVDCPGGGRDSPNIRYPK